MWMKEGFHRLLLNNPQTGKRVLEKMRQFTVLIMLYILYSSKFPWSKIFMIFLGS